MKQKLFSIFCCLLLSASMVTQAQLLDAGSDNFRGRNNAPTAIQGQSSLNVSLSWKGYAGKVDLGTNGSIKGMMYQWTSNGYNSGYPQIKITFCYTNGQGVTYSGTDYDNYNFSVECPPKGAYTFRSTVQNNTAGNYDFMWGNKYRVSMLYGNSSSYYFNVLTGSVTVNEGVDGPYIYFDGTYNPGGGTATYSTATVGTYPTYRTVYVRTDDNTTTKGTVSYAMKSGYFYTDIDGTYVKHWKNNSVYTLTATPKSGYRFVCWKNGSTQISTNAVTDVTITGNATYTAYFEREGGTQYTITVQADNDAYCTVSGGGTYYEGDHVTISSASKNEHLYIFDMFMLEGEDEDQGEPSFEIEVTGNATYTAYYRLAKSGTITAATNNASYGTASASLTGSQPGGTAVTLTATPNSGCAFVQWNDGNTDNPRTVYVDGDKTYTAQFVVETPLCAAVKYNTANHEIDWGKHGDQDWNDNYMSWNSANDMFIRLRASDYTDNSMNHIQLCFWVNDFSVTYNGTIGPKAGTYTVVQPYVAGYNTYNNYWDLDISYLNNAIVGSNPAYVVGGWNTSLAMVWTTSHSPYCAYVANRSCDYCSPTDFEGIPIGSTAKVEKGKGGYCYVEVRNASGTLLFTVGEKASSYTLAWDTNGGNITVAGTAAGSVTEGASITAPTVTRTGYTFNGWSPTFTGTMPAANTTYVAQWTANTHNVSWVTDGNALAGTYTNGTTAYGTTIVAPNTPTKNATAEYTYAFNGWSPAVDATMPDNDVTYTAQWTATPVNYTLTWDFDGGSTVTAVGDYTNGTVAYGTTIVAPADPTKEGCTFNGWDVTPAGTMPAANTTYTAQWTACATELHIVLDEHAEDGDDYYDDFQKYNGVTAKTVTLKRQFTQSRWATLCLPFEVSGGQMTNLRMKGRVYEFMHATGNANDGNQVTLFFAQAEKLTAGKAYIVNANAKLAELTQFVFYNVTINTSADQIKPLNSISQYNDLADMVGYSDGTGTIQLVGTLRLGTLKGTGEHETYMGLKDNKIYYPNTSTGSTVWAYRGIFRGTSALNAQRVRIVVDGEDAGELEVVNGELQQVPEARKFIQDGVLYIEREGVIYDAAGQRVN